MATNESSYVILTTTKDSKMAVLVKEKIMISIITFIRPRMILLYCQMLKMRKFLLWVEVWKGILFGFKKALTDLGKWYIAIKERRKVLNLSNLNLNAESNSEKLCALYYFILFYIMCSLSLCHTHTHTHARMCIVKDFVPSSSGCLLFRAIIAYKLFS